MFGVQRTWSGRSFSLRWREVPYPDALEGLFRNVNLAASWRDRNRTVSTTTGQNQGSRTVTRSLSIGFVFNNGFNFSYQLDDASTDRSDQTGGGESDRTSHSLRLTGSLPPPSFLGFVKKPVRMAAEYSLNGNFDCRALGGSGFDGVVPGLGGDCTAHVDQTTQSAAFTLDSDFTGYTDRCPAHVVESGERGRTPAELGPVQPEHLWSLRHPHRHGSRAGPLMPPDAVAGPVRRPG